MDEHNEILPHLAAYHDGMLDTTEREAVEHHLAGCASCRKKLTDWTSLDSALMQLPVAERATVELHDRAMARIETLAGVPAPEPVRASQRIRVYTVAAAAVLLFGLATTLIWQRERPLPMVEGDLGLNERARETDAQKTQRARDDRNREQAQPEKLATQPTEGAQDVERDAVDTDRVEQPQPTLAASGTESVTPSQKLAQQDMSAPVPVVTGDSGIPQLFDWPARYYDSIEIETFYRSPWTEPVLELAELNVVPQFEAGFVGIGYRSLNDGLNPQHEAAHTDPVQLSPETSYLVSNLRLEQTSLMARTPQGQPSADVALRLAEITWRLANLTADGDDVKNAIAAQHLASKYRPELAGRSQSRVATLRAMTD